VRPSPTSCGALERFAEVREDLPDAPWLEPTLEITAEFLLAIGLSTVRHRPKPGL
jgi:hypothetical protein